MDIGQISATEPPSRLHDQVPATRRVAHIEPVAREREPWDEAIFLRAYNGFAAQLSRSPFDGDNAKLSELALLYQRSSATTLEAFAGHILTTHRT